MLHKFSDEKAENTSPRYLDAFFLSNVVKIEINSHYKSFIRYTISRKIYQYL